MSVIGPAIYPGHVPLPAPNVPITVGDWLVLVVVLAILAIGFWLAFRAIGPAGPPPPPPHGGGWHPWGPEPGPSPTDDWDEDLKRLLEEQLEPQAA